MTAEIYKRTPYIKKERILWQLKELH
jgi:hypothetical protein